MTELRPPTGGDYRRICALALVSIVPLAAAGLMHAFVPPSLGPRVNIRWADGVDDAARLGLERRLRLFAGEQREGSTWMYDLGDPTPEGIKKLITDPSVADTLHIDRTRATVSEDAPQGTTRIAPGRLSAWRDSLFLNWAVRLSLSLLVVSATWLATTGRAAKQLGTRSE